MRRRQGFREVSIFNPRAIKRGYAFGWEVSKLYFECRAVGHTQALYRDLKEQRAIPYSAQGLVSPIGEVAGHLVGGAHHFFGKVIKRQK